MSEVESTSSTTAGGASTERPAIGLIATHGNGDEIAGAILRAHRHGHEAIVTALDHETDGLEYARQLDAVAVPPPTGAPNNDSLQSTLTEAARQAGFPGVVMQDDPSIHVDFEASMSTLIDSGEYAVDAEQAARIDGTPDVMVAIPAYNEAATIGDVVRGATAHADTVVVIDDGSADETVEQAVTAGAETIVHETNQGYGAALQTAFREAERAGADHLVILDGDGQHDPADIPELVRTQEDQDAEIVIGSRLVDEGTTDAPLYRRVGLSVVNVVTNLSLGVVRPESRIRDTQSGFRAYSRPAIESLAADGEIGTQMSASTDILYHAHHRDYDVVEVGTEITYDGEHTSSQHPVTHGVTLMMNLLRTVERDRPVTVLGVPGFISALLGIGFGYWTLSTYIASGVFPLGLAVTSVFFALAGIFACFTAIILHSLNTHLSDNV